MSFLKASSTSWFEILAPRVECAKSLGNLGRTGAVEIEVREHDEALLNVSELADGLDNYRQLAKRYHHYWSRGVMRHAASSHSPRDILDKALTGIQRWQQAADPVIEQLQQLEEEHTSLGYCLRFINGIKHSDIDFSLATTSGPVVVVINAIFPEGTDVQLESPHLAVQVEHEQDTCFMAVTSEQDKLQLEREIKAINGRIIERPAWIQGDAQHALAAVNARINWLEENISTLYARLDELYSDYRLADVLGDVVCLNWFLEQVGTLEPEGSNLVWITGWTIAGNSEQLSQVLAEAGVPALVHFPAPPAGAEPPQILRNPWWSKPFELFTRAFGTPGQNEVDPSSLLAFIVPLLFGYMFADVGQGLVLAVTGFILQKHWAGGRLLLIAGLAATLFGFLFGSFFSIETIIPAMLFHPLHDPLLTLSLPILFGAGLIMLGHLLEGIEALWRGDIKTWLFQHGGLVLLYLGALASLIKIEWIYIALAGAAWFVIGNALTSGKWIMLFAAVGKLLEDSVRLLVNTVSFARVGAFALAHAGLSSAVVALSETTSSAIISLLIMILGNIVVIVLEGLVVSIQTTRLVLFEFFVRFFQGSGRVFRPLVPPPDVANVPPSKVL